MARRFLTLPNPLYPDLATYLEKSGDSQGNIARTIGVKQAHISRIVAGQMVPRPELAARLAAYCKVPLDSFIKVYLAKKSEVA
jgi:transcriptional regulator with XRE-family HTH domain